MEQRNTEQPVIEKIYDAAFIGYDVSICYIIYIMSYKAYIHIYIYIWNVPFFSNLGILSNSFPFVKKKSIHSLNRSNK